MVGVIRDWNKEPCIHRQPIIQSFYDNENYLHLYNGKGIDKKYKPRTHRLPRYLTLYDCINEENNKKYSTLIYEILIEAGVFSNCNYRVYETNNCDVVE